MLVLVLAWVFILSAASLIGAAVLAAFGADHVRPGDRVVLGAWLGVVLLALALLGVSLFAPLSPGVGAATTAVLAGTSWWVTRRNRHSESRWRASPDIPVSRWALVLGVTCIAIGAAALASDRVTLYDSLVYHVGIMRWLREHGTVPGVALIHNRLGHVSAWFSLGAPFDAGIVTDRAANVPLGVALVLVAGQTALAAGRLAVRRATGADAFLGLSSAMLLWAAVRYGAATPSPDTVANALIVVVAWSLLALSHVTPASRARWAQRWLTPRLLPFVLAVGASTMKLFAAPAAVAAALFYTFAPGDDRGTSLAARRGAVCVAVALVLALPFLAANVVASGCPLFPSPIGCVSGAWSVGADAAATYAEYIRDVARWEIRRTFRGAETLAWLGPWVAAHPVVFVLGVLSPVLAAVLLVGPRRGGVRSALLVAILGLAFAAWQAPAPRFLYAFAIIAPALALAYPLAGALQARGTPSGDGEPFGARRAAIAFVASSVVIGGAYALASQKLNVRSALRGESPFVVVARDELLLPGAPERPSRLYRWRVNDIEVFTPVPRPIADTLAYTSTIDGRIGFEKCSTAPLPCTPYIPLSDVRLRSRARRLGGGFVRAPLGEAVTAEGPRCVGALLEPFSSSMLAATGGPALGQANNDCGEPAKR